MKLVYARINEEELAANHGSFAFWQWKDIKPLFEEEDVVQREIVSGSANGRRCNSVQLDLVSGIAYLYVAKASESGQWIAIKSNFTSELQRTALRNQVPIKVYITRYIGGQKSKFWFLAFLMASPIKQLEDYCGLMINLAARNPEAGDYTFADEEKISVITEKLLKGELKYGRT